jgi:hypothetical protein
MTGKFASSVRGAVSQTKAWMRTRGAQEPHMPGSVLES